MMNGVPLETCLAFKKIWNNKFYYKAVTCWYFYWIIYDARIREYQIYLTLVPVKVYNTTSKTRRMRRDRCFIAPRLKDVEVDGDYAEK
jgi:hypothetical protein